MVLIVQKQKWLVSAFGNFHSYILLLIFDLNLFLSKLTASSIILSFKIINTIKYTIPPHDACNIIESILLFINFPNIILMQNIIIEATK